MKRTNFSALLAVVAVTASGVALAFTPLDSIDAESNLYLVGSGTVQSGKRYELRNKWSESAMIYTKQSRGINMGWGKNTNGVRLTKESGGVIKYGDTIAFGVSNGYLQYDKRTWGINLKWTNKDRPVYEWIVKGGKDGDPVQLGQPITIHNTKESDHLFYCIRHSGAWVKWSKDCSKTERAATYANAKR